MPHKGYKQTEKHRRKISKNHADISREKNPMFGKHHTSKSKKKISDSRKEQKHPNWKGGRRKSQDGYWMIYKPEHPRTTKRDPYVAEHILIAEKMLGRYLKPEEIVHHINFKREDNKEENIHIFENSSKHQRVKKSYFNLAPILIEKRIMDFDKKKEEYVLKNFIYF